MNKSKLIVLIIGVITFGIFSYWKVHANIELNTANTQEEVRIKDVVIAYFDARYRSFSTLQLEDFEDLVSASPQLDSEKDKLYVELNHAKSHQLGYTEYEYNLDFTIISINETYQEATVFVTEGHDVVFEISEKLSKDRPVVSSMRNLEHKITLRKVLNTWMIVNDEYEDYLWRMINETGLSIEDFQSSEMQFPDDESLNSISGDGVTLNPDNLCSLPQDQSIHPYLRSLAINYAHRWADSRNPRYYDFSDDGGDCTNFISQAIHEWGDAEMVYGGYTFGWYYKDGLNGDYSPSWTHVDYFYSHIIQYLVWPLPGDDPDGPGGPEGCEVLSYQAYPGDVIQYDMKGIGYWDHGAIIVKTDFLSDTNRYHYVASHSPDHDDYPYTKFMYDYNYPNMVTRFLHIDRIDGYSKRFIPMAINYISGSQNKAQDPDQKPYPAPIVPGEQPPLLPYPPP